MGRSVFALSGGEKQKIACASSSVLLPGIMVLDEPSSNLDMAAIDDLRQVLSLWKKQGKTILIAEHRLYYLHDLADRVLYVKMGRLNGNTRLLNLTAYRMALEKKWDCGRFLSRS